MRDLFASSIVFRLWLALSVIATGLAALAFIVYVWLAISENLNDAHHQTRGKAEVLVATLTQADLDAPDVSGDDLGLLKVEMLDVSGALISTLGIEQEALQGPPLSPRRLAAAQAGPVSRPLRFDAGRAVPRSISPLDVVRGGVFGEEQIIAVPTLLADQPGYLRVLAVYPDLSADARQLAQDAAMVTVLALGVSLTAMWPFLKRFVSRPLIGYSSLAMRMAVGERVRMPAEGAGELGELGRAVNSMADALQHQATVDALTGLYNLRHLSSNLEELISEASAKNRPLTVIVGDLDELKLVNDAYGHQAGDRVLRAVAETMRGWAGASYVCWRLGGDEFVVALPNVDEPQGLVVAASLRKVIGAINVPVADTLVRPSISVGIATFPSDETSAGALIGIADRRMYVAKTSQAQERQLNSTAIAPNS